MSKVLVYICDNCGEQHSTETDNYKEALADAKLSGWFFIKDNEKYYDFCCKECFLSWKKDRPK